MKTNLEKHKHYQKTSRYQFCEIPNDEEGKQLVKSLRKYLNRHVYTIRVKGQYLDKVKYPDTYWDKGAPIDACTHIRVYVDEKPEIRSKQWRDQIVSGIDRSIHILQNDKRRFENE